jgi:hypothetical protein
MTLADEIDESWTDFLASDEASPPRSTVQMRSLLAKTGATFLTIAAHIDRLESELRSKGVIEDP